MMPPAAPWLAHAETQRRRGRDVVGEADRDAGGGDNLGAGARKGLGAEAGVVADAEALGRVFFGVHVGGDGFGGGADIGKSEVVGDDAAPAVGTELDLGMRHVYEAAPERKC